MTPAEVAAALARLRDARPALLRAERERIVDELAALLDDWRDPRFAWRRRLEQELPKAAGFSPAVVREGLARGLAPWTGDALRDAVRRELGAFADPSAVCGFETTAVLLAGAIPMPSLLALLLPLVLRSPVLAKPSAGDPVTARLVAASLAERNAELGRCVEVVAFPGADAACTAAFLSAPCVVASGSDETLEAVARRLGPGQRLVAHGHRLSVAVLGPEALVPGRVADVAARLALDTVLWDQLGCLSPVAVYAVDPDGAGAARLTEALAAALASAEKDLPRGALTTDAAAAISRERSLAELRTASGQAVAVHRSRGTEWTVVLEADPAPRAAPLHRFLRVHPVAEARALPQALAPLAPHLAAAAVEGFAPGEEGDLARACAELGASRVCRPGSLQSPPLAWHRGGLPLLLPLARVCDEELA